MQVLRGHAAHVLFMLAAIGSVSSPPLANIAAFVGLLAFFSIPGAGVRLRRAAAQPAGTALLAFLALMALAMTWADVEWPRRLAAWWSWRPLILLLFASALFDDARWKDRFAQALVAFLVLAALVSFALRLLPTPMGIDNEPGVILRNHATQGMAFVAGTVLAAMLAWGRPATARMRQALLAAMALFVANIALISTGRSAHLALLVAGALFAFSLLRGRRRWTALVLIPVLGAVLLASSSMVRERFTTAYGELDTVMTSPWETSTGLRIVIWTTTVELIRQRPLLGYGVGGLPPAYAALVHQRYTGWQAAEAKDTHNQYLHVMVEAGIPGVLAFLAFIVAVVRQRAAAPYRGAALALFAAWLVTSLFNSHFQTFAEAHLIGIVLGVLLAGGAAAQGEAGTGASAGASAAPAAAATSS